MFTLYKACDPAAGVGPMYAVDVDAERGRVTLGAGTQRLTLRGKSVSLVAFLVVSDQWATTEDIHNLPDWKDMAHSSVGKQVARIIDRLLESGFDIVGWRAKTNGWRLKSDVRAALNADTVRAARAFLDRPQSRPPTRFRAMSAGEMAQWALNATSATLAMTAGRADDGYASLRLAYASTDNPDLLAIANVLATRIGQRLEEPHAIVSGGLGSQASIFEVSVEARRLAAYAIRTESSAWEQQVNELTRLLTRLGGSAALTTQATVFNAIALLLRRLGRYDESLAHVQEAVPLAVFSGDYSLIQSVFFNFGNILSEIRRADPHAAPGADPLALLEMDLAIRRQFGLGKDSGQAELLLAYLAWEHGDLDRADVYIAAANSIIVVSRVRADQALFYRVSGLVAIARANGRPCPEGVGFLDEAIRLFDRIGNKSSADYVRGERERFG